MELRDAIDHGDFASAALAKFAAAAPAAEEMLLLPKP
jgi:hypothetical protein